MVQGTVVWQPTCKVSWNCRHTWQASFPPWAYPAHITRSSMLAVLNFLKASLHCAWLTTGICNCCRCEADGPSATGHKAKWRNWQTETGHNVAQTDRSVLPDTHWIGRSPTLQYRGSSSRSHGCESLEQVAGRWAELGLQTQRPSGSSLSFVIAHPVSYVVLGP